MRWVTAEASLAEPGIKKQDFNYFILSPYFFLLLYLHLIFFSLGSFWIRINFNGFSLFHIVNITEPSKCPEVAYSLYCLGHIPSLSSHHFLSLLMVIFLTVSFPSSMPGKCTSKPQKNHHCLQRMYSQSSDVWDCPSLQWDIPQAPGVSNIFYTIWAKLCRWCNKSCSTHCANLMETDQPHSHL